MGEMGIEITAEEIPEQYQLPLPSLEEARHILRELEWGDHFVGVEMNPASGNRNIYLYSLQETGRFLRNGNAGLSFSASQGGTISWIDIDKFSTWIKESIGDAVLADAITDAAAENASYHDQVFTLGRLVDARLVQLFNLIDEENAEDD